MNTKLLMIFSALLMASGGILLQFVPHEILNSLGTFRAASPFYSSSSQARYIWVCVDELDGENRSDRRNLCAPAGDR